MKLKIFIAFLSVATFGFAVYSAAKKDVFAPAEDFPRGALVYVQVDDLPQFIRLWNDSKFKEKYLAGENFSDLQNRHLGRKLASRWHEFNDAAGFSFDLETLAGLSENRAAFAVYDVGKMDFVLIAPVSDEIFAATKFIQNKDKFTEETLGDGTTIYRADIAADRGRQKQQLIFTHLKNRFVLTTDIKLLAQTVSNLNGNKLKNRLSDEPLFSTLADKSEPHLATVWANQTALNDDYYFKHYWLMSDAKDLQNLRAGIFDFEMQADKLIEHRRFLLNNAVVSKSLDAAHSAEMLTHLPENIPFYRLRNADSQAVDEVVKQTIFDRRQSSTVNSHYSNSTDYSGDFSDDYSSGDDDYLNENYDRNIDDTDENEAVETTETKTDFAEILRDAEPQIILDLTRPETKPAPLFVEFQRAAVFYLAAPENFNRDRFESEIARQYAAQTMIKGADENFQWQTKTDGDRTTRELVLPMLDWKVVYQIRGNQLVLTNDADFFGEIASAKNQNPNEPKNAPMSELTVINLDQRANAYDRVFDRLDREKVADVFFTGNVSSFLNSISDVKKIEVKKNYTGKFFEEEIIFNGEL